MNFTEMDTLAVLKASMVLAPIMFAPGYVVGWALDLFQFRQRRSILRFVLAVPLSIAVCPIVSYLLARFLQPGLWVFYLGATAACLLLLAKEIRQNSGLSSKSTSIGVGLAAIWVITAIGSLADLQFGDKLYMPIAAYDHSTRVAMTAAIARHVPPANPFFAHPAVPLRYHYLWMLLCSLPLKLFHLSARHLMYAGVVWCGLGLICVIALGIKFLLNEQAATANKTLIGVALLCVTGLDILPTLYVAAVGRLWLPDMEWWNEAQITSWAASLLWVPHHVAALVACFVGFILLRHETEPGGRQWIVSPIVAGIAFASAAGLSIYVTFTFAVAVGFWLLALIVRKDWKEAAMFASAGIVAMACALPYLSSLNSPAADNNTMASRAFVELALRPFPLGLHLANRLGLAITSHAGVTAANALLLPVNYALELGFFLAIAIFRLRQVLRGTVSVGTNELAGWTFLMTSFAIGTLVRSTAIRTNDLGIRCFLPAQLMLLLWGASMIHDWWFESAKPAYAPRPLVRRVFFALLFIGGLGSAYEVFMIRMAPVLYDRWQIAGIDWLDSDRQGGKRTYALRSAYEALDAQLPSSAVVQHNPDTRSYIPHTLYSGHDAAAGDRGCGTAFGGDPEVCEQRVRRLAALFAFTGSDLEAVCREHGIDVVLAKDTDPAWHNPSSWIWTQRPLVANNYVRAFQCGTASASVHY